MFRTALGESTASLDSTIRSGWSQASSLVSGGGGGGNSRGKCRLPGQLERPRPGRSAVVVDEFLRVFSGSLMAENLPEPHGAILAHAEGAQ